MENFIVNLKSGKWKGTLGTAEKMVDMISVINFIKGKKKQQQNNEI